MPCPTVPERLKYSEKKKFTSIATYCSNNSSSSSSSDSSIHGNVGASFWWRDALPHTNQLGLGKRCWNLGKLFRGS